MFIDYAAGNTVSLSASFSFDLALFSRCLAVKRPLDLLGHTRQRTSMPPDATNPSVRFVYFPLSTLLLLTKHSTYQSISSLCVLDVVTRIPCLAYRKLTMSSRSVIMMPVIIGTRCKGISSYRVA